MGQNIQQVRVVDINGTIVTIDDDTGGLIVHPTTNPVETLVDVQTETTSGTNKTLIAAPGAGIRIHLVGMVITTDTAGSILVHWATGTTDPVLRFNYIENGGVAYHWGAYGPRGAANELLGIDIGTTGNTVITTYYHLD